jgi:EAL domain-containing protein (putative c-di-GMP-specific phosphodiesterase class I)
VADSDEPPHYEILLRMEDEVGEIIAPGAFLPAAERYGLSVKVDRWVVTTALAWMQSQIDTPAADTRYAINLSGHSLSDNDFLRFLTEALRDTAVDAGRICIEITETAAISNLTKAGRFIGALKDLGCRFALDDFGSGLSSFAYLKNLPVDFLKIDGAFVKGLAHDDMGQAMVRSIHDVGKMMGKRTIAEFVDGAETLSTLKKIGVDYAQGYYLGKPAPIESWPGES